jgi:AbrB family looped-hinge helix DNA binding protein
MKFMAKTKRPTTVISTKGQVILPKAVREDRNWRPGTRLTVEVTADGVLLKSSPSIPRTRSEEVFGILAHSGSPLTLEDMDAAITAEARRRHVRD